MVLNSEFRTDEFHLNALSVTASKKKNPVSRINLRNKKPFSRINLRNIKQASEINLRKNIKKISKSI